MLLIQNGDANADSPISISMNELQSQTDANVDAITGINELLANASSSTQVVAEEVAAVAAAVNTVSQAAAGAATACAELATSHAEDMVGLRGEMDGMLPVVRCTLRLPPVHVRVC